MEMLVVIAIMAVVSALVWPYSSNTKAFDGRTAARQEIVRLFRQAQATAQMTNRPVWVVLDMKRRTLQQLGNSEGYTFPADLTIETRSARMTGENGNAEFIFFPTGETSGGTVSLNTQGYHETIFLQWLTGEIRVKDGVP